jgi:hypothetical protein
MFGQKYISRRRFLTIVLAGGGATAVGIATNHASFLGPLRGLYYRMAFPDLEERPTGGLARGTIDTLLGAVDALCGPSLEKNHYEVYFGWRSENLRGYKALYEQFETTLNTLAKKSNGYVFAQCSSESRKQILLDAVSAVRYPESRLGRAKVGIFARRWVLFDRYIIQEMLSIFARTDAWVRIGYSHWPGQPGGLESYRQAPLAVTNGIVS